MVREQVKDSFSSFQVYRKAISSAYIEWQVPPGTTSDVCSHRGHVRDYIVYSVVLELIVSASYTKAHVHCSNRTGLGYDCTTANTLDHERKNKPALKYGISGEIQHLLVVDQCYKGIIRDTE